MLLKILGIYHFPSVSLSSVLKSVRVCEILRIAEQQENNIHRYTHAFPVVICSGLLYSPLAIFPGI